MKFSKEVVLLISLKFTEKIILLFNYLELYILELLRLYNTNTFLVILI